MLERSRNNEASASHRNPQRSPGRKRFGALLNATEQLLTECSAEDLTLARIAERAEVPVSSIYHFFPNKNAAYTALAQRFHAQLREISERPMTPAPRSWQAVIEDKQRAGAKFLNEHPAALHLFMGAGISVDVRNLDLSSNVQLAQSRAAYLRRYFHMPRLPDLENHLAVAIGLTDGIWAISYSAERRITPFYAREALRATVLYLRSYLPEFLEPRDISNQPDGGSSEEEEASRTI